MIMNTAHLIELPRITDIRGDLSFVENMDQVPFSIKRVYWLTGVVSGAWREGHAYRSQWELLVALSGSFTVVSDGVEGPSLWHLDKPSDGLLMPPLTWRELHRFSANAVALVLSSGEYAESEYVRSRNEFDALIGRRS